VETENPSTCATVNWNVCKSAIALYLSVIKRNCNQGGNKSNHPKQNPSFRHAYHPTRDNIFYINIYKTEYNSFSRKVKTYMTQILRKDPSTQLPPITTITTTVDQPNNMYTDM
jgi:hypothetical protein